MKGSLWLAIEDALSHGVSMPDMVSFHAIAHCDSGSAIFPTPLAKANDTLRQGPTIKLFVCMEGGEHVHVRTLTHNAHVHACTRTRV